MADSERDHTREPLFWAFVIVAVVVAVLAVSNRTGANATDATFLAKMDVTTAQDPAELQALPTPEPTPAAQQTQAIVDLAYSDQAITLAGVVPAPAVADALLAAAGQVVGPESVTSEITVDPQAPLDGGLLVMRGEVDDEQERAAVIAAFADLGFDLDDRLALAGSTQTIADILTNNEDLTEFREFLAASGLLAELGSETEAGLTLFAPTNAAVQGIDRAAFEELGDADQLAEVLRYHMVNGRIATSDLVGVTAVTSLQGESISVDAGGAELVVGGATVIDADVAAVNGVVHIVDRVLLPGTLRTEVALNQLVRLEPVLFSSGSANIAEESLPILDSAVTLLRENPLGRVEIQGHTDSDGPSEVNLDLSQQRADAVRDYLIEQGIDGARLSAVGFGETELKVDPEEDDDDKFANRRIEFRVT